MGKDDLSKFKDLTGKKFGKLFVIGSAHRVGDDLLWVCVCDCKKEKLVRGRSLKSGNTRSCGCLHQGVTKHGMHKRPEYSAYVSMKGRCSNPRDVGYKHYGGRGIKVCDRWLESFENFFEDMGERPSDKHSLDRIDVNGNYEPKNCRWADKSTQGKNKRFSTRDSSRYKGVTWYTNYSKWRAVICSGGKTQHIGYFDNEIEAANAFDKAARELSYEESWLNFPKEVTNESE